MAVLHHAFRCPVTPLFREDVAALLAAWRDGDRDALSAMALAGYALLREREDVHAAFYLGPDGAVPSWLQPDFISPGLAALTGLARGFIRLPNLSSSADANHWFLVSQLPALGWASGEIESLVQGQPIETMLRSYAEPACPLQPGGFRHTGGWTSGRTALALSARLKRFAQARPADADTAQQAAWQRLNESHALQDAQAMLAPLTADDWLIMSITH
jgi:hypothetical protein